MIFFVKVFVFLFFLGILTLSSASRYASFNDFINQKAKLYLPNVQKISSSTASSSSTPTTTNISAEDIEYTAWLFLLIKILGGSFGSYGVVITFKFIRNGFMCKKNWFVIKFVGYHGKKQDDQDEFNRHEMLDLVVSNPSTSINPVQ